MELEEGKYCNGTFMELCLTHVLPKHVMLLLHVMMCFGREITSYMIHSTTSSSPTLITYDISPLPISRRYL
jgi:hypothetical protein